MAVHMCTNGAKVWAVATRTAKALGFPEVDDTSLAPEALKQVATLCDLMTNFALDLDDGEVLIASRQIGSDHELLPEVAARGSEPVFPDGYASRYQSMVWPSDLDWPRVPIRHTPSFVVHTPSGADCCGGW